MSQFNIQDYIDKKSEIIFDFVVRGEKKPLTLNHLLNFPEKLRKQNKHEHAAEITEVYREYFKRLQEASKNSGASPELTKEEFVVANRIIRKTQWFSEVFVEKVSAIYFDSIDRNQDSLLSLDEWREMYRSRGIENETFVQSTFRKMDRDGDGWINRKEFLYAFTQLGVGDDESQDFSFIYDIKHF